MTLKIYVSDTIHKYKEHTNCDCYIFYFSSRWMVCGVGDTMKQNQIYDHPESPMTGEYLTSQVISFEKIKLTNHEKPGSGQVNILSFSIQEKKKKKIQSHNTLVFWFSAHKRLCSMRNLQKLGNENPRRAHT